MNLLLSRYVLCSSFLGHSYYQQLHKNLNRDPEIFSKAKKGNKITSPAFVDVSYRQRFYYLFDFAGFFIISKEVSYT